MNGRPDRLPFTAKASFGFGSVAFGVTQVGAAVGSVYLNQVLGIPAFTVGVAIMASLAMDTLLDLVIGRWSDRVRTPWGRRHPFLYASALPAAAFFFLIWNPPGGLSGGALVGFMILVITATRLAVSFYEIPSNALTPELTADFDERTVLQSWRWLFGVIGGVGASLVLNIGFLGRSHAGVLYREGYERWGLIAALVILASILVSAIGTQGRVARMPPRPQGAQSVRDQRREIAKTLMNRSLLALVLGGVIGGVGTGLRTVLEVYFYTHVWDLTPAQYGWIAPMVAVGSIVAVVITPPLGRRFGKKRAMIGLFVISTFLGAGPLFLRLIGVMPPNGSPWILPILALDTALASALGIVGFILAGSMTADVVEDAAVRSGARSEGLLYAVNGLITKFTGGVGAFVAGVVLTVVHFPVHAARGTVDPTIVRHLIEIYLPVSVLLSLTAIASLSIYRIDRQTHERNLDALRAAALAPEGEAP